MSQPPMFGSVGRSGWAVGVGLLVVAVLAVLFVGTGSVQAQGAGSVVVSEIFYNPDGQDEGSEFVELFNASSDAVDVSGWRFTSGIDVVFDADTTIAPDGYLVVANDPGVFEAAFGFAPDAGFSGSLSNGGEQLVLETGLGEIAQSVTYDDGVPWPRSPDGDGDSLQILDVAKANDVVTNWGAGSPTPGAESAVHVDVVFDVGRGWYSGSQTVTLTATVPGATIRYNTSGSGSVSTVYSGPITVSDNGGVQVIQAQASLGNAEGELVTHSYVFEPDVGIPVVTLWPNGMSVASGESESTRSFEFIAPPSTGLSPAYGNAGVRKSAGGYHAGSSDKVFFRGEYGNGTLDGDLFSDFYYGDIEPVERHDQLFLRGRHQDESLLKQLIAHDAAAAAGSLAPHGRFVRLYDQGRQSVRHLQERPEGGFMESYTGIDKTNWDSYNSGTLDWDWGGSWAEAVRDINVENFADYAVVQWHANVTDGFSSKNWRVAIPEGGNPGDGGDYRWHFFNWDLDLGYHTTQGWNLGGCCPLFNNRWVTPDYIGNELFKFVEMRYLMSDRVTCAFEPGGTLDPPVFAERVATRGDEAIRAGHTNSVSNVVDNASGYAAGRRDFLIPQMRTTDPPSGPLYPSGEPVTASIIDNELVIASPNPGTIYYRLDGGDPRTLNGTLDPAAIEYTGPTPLPAGRTEIIARSFDAGDSNTFDAWSPACNKPVQLESVPAAGLVINEVHYNPLPQGSPDDPNYVDGDRFEFVELTNTTDTAQSLTGVEFTKGIDYQFASNTIIGPGEHLVLAADATHFEARYGFAPDGVYSGDQLANGGETVTLTGPAGVLDSFVYTDTAPWPTTPDGDGPSLTLRDTTLDNSLAESWARSANTHGSPGEDNTTTPGDVNVDGFFTTADIHAVLDHLSGQTPPAFNNAAADTNSDGNINLLDALELAQMLDQ